MQYELHGWPTITTLPVWTNKLCRTVSPNRSWWSQQWIRRIIHVTNWMAGPILTSSPHYFSAVQILLCLFSEKLAGSGYLAEQTKDPQITLPIWTNKLCTTSLRGKDSIFYANGLVTSMYWVVKWATLIKPKLIRIVPQGAPRGPEWKTQAYMNHQRKSYKWRLGLALMMGLSFWPFCGLSSRKAGLIGPSLHWLLPVEYFFLFKRCSTIH